MNKLMVGLGMAAALGAFYANGARRARREQRALERAELARWENEVGAPQGQPGQRGQAPDGAPAEESMPAAH